MKVWLEIERGRVKTGKSMKNSRHMSTACRLSVVDNRGYRKGWERIVSLNNQTKNTP